MPENLSQVSKYTLVPIICCIFVLIIWISRDALCHEDEGDIILRVNMISLSCSYLLLFDFNYDSVPPFLEIISDVESWILRLRSYWYDLRCSLVSEISFSVVMELGATLISLIVNSLSMMLGAWNEGPVWTLWLGWSFDWNITWIYSW